MDRAIEAAHRANHCLRYVPVYSYLSRFLLPLRTEIVRQAMAVVELRLLYGVQKLQLPYSSDEATDTQFARTFLDYSGQSQASPLFGMSGLRK